jgi:hypothetical protein
MLPVLGAGTKSGVKISVEGSCQTCYEIIKTDPLFFLLAALRTKTPVNTDYPTTF